MSALVFQKSAGMEKSHRFADFTADNSTYTSSNKREIILKVEVPAGSGEYIDMESVKLFGDDNAADSLTGVYNDWSASSAYKSLTVRSMKQTEIANQLVDYNGYCRMKGEFMSSDDNNSSYLKVLEGAKNDTLAANNNSIQRAHQFQSNIFTFPGYYPAFAHGGLEVRLTMEDASKRMALSAGTAAYTLDNLKINCRLVKLKDEVHNQVVAKLATPEGLIIDFKSAEGTNQTVVAATGVKTYKFGKASQRLTAVHSFVVRDSIRDGTADHWEMSAVGISNYRFKIGSEYITQNPVEVTTTSDTQYKLAEHLTHQLRASGQEGLPAHMYGDSALTVAAFRTDRFLMSGQLQKSKSQAVISSADVAEQDIDLIVNFGSSPGAGTVYLYKEEDRRIQILPGQQVMMVN